ncbi:NAD-binding protein [Oceanobacillus sp. CAU 1775]
MQNKKLIVHYYIVAVIAMFLFWFFVSKEAAIDPVIFTILIIYLLVFPLTILYIRKYAVHIFLFLLAFITGFYSFYHYSLDDHSILNAFYFTFQLFLLMVADVFSSDGSVLLEYPLIVEIARWSAALYTISTIFIAMYRMLENSILLIFYQLKGNHTIVFGYNKNSLALIEDLRKKKKHIILIAEHPPQEVVDYLETLKVAVIHHYDLNENMYAKCGVERAENIILLHEDDVDNLNEFMSLRDSFESHKWNNRKLTVYIHLQEPMSRKLFIELEQTTVKSKQYFQIQQINLYESFVDDLFERHAISIHGEKSSPMHLLIIGFGLLGQQIALKAATENNSLEKSQLKITALDKAMKRIKPEFGRNYSELQQLTDMTFHTFDVTIDTIEKVIKEQVQPITHIFICLHDDALDLWSGIELSNQFPDIPIYLEFSDGSFAEKWIESEVSGDRLMYSLGTFDKILTEEKLLK